jgi:hypothetical protein
MMNAAMRATMTCIGFTIAGAQQVIVDEQNILSSLYEIQLFTDDEIESLCKVLRHPGGMLGPGAAPGVLVQNPGVQVNQQRAEGHMRLMVFYLRYQARVRRVATSADITLNSIRTVREILEFELTYKSPTDNLPTINVEDCQKTMETIDEYLRSHLGERKIVPLAYVVQKNQAILEGDDPSINYSHHQEGTQGGC